MLPVLGDKNLDAIRKDEIEQLKKSMFDRGYSGNTINKALSALKTIFENAFDNRIIDQVPKIERARNNPKEKGILTPDV